MVISMPSYETVFMSHAHADNEICTRITERLRVYGIDVWLDRHDAQRGSSLTDTILAQIDSRSAFLLMYTHASAQSFWVGLERDAFLGRIAKDRSLLFLTIRLEPIEIPSILNGLIWIDAVGRPLDEVINEIVQTLDKERPHILTPLRLTPNRRNTRRSFFIGAGLGAVGLAVAGYEWYEHAYSQMKRGKNTLPSLPTSTPQPNFVPSSLLKLGFVGHVVNGQRVIIPPTANVPAGSFLMGSDPNVDPNAKVDEMPQHNATIDQAYSMGIYPITVAEYALAYVVGVVPKPVNNIDPSSSPWEEQLLHLDHPVVNVSWFDALNYARWLATLTGKPWRLPTEAEWEKGARGTDGRIYPWGNQWDNTRANTSDGGPGTTTPVGQYAAQHDDSPYHFHDMAGNVFTWCSTIYDQSSFPYPYVESDGRESASDSTSNRIVRGGGWSRSPQDARCAARGWDSPSFRHDLVGIRLGYVQ
jgi:formylglycine-generating enzyme required for sulfatase activity